MEGYDSDRQADRQYRTRDERGADKIPVRASSALGNQCSGYTDGPAQRAPQGSMLTDELNEQEKLTQMLTQAVFTMAERLIGPAREPNAALTVAGKTPIGVIEAMTSRLQSHNGMLRAVLERVSQIHSELG